MIVISAARWVAAPMLAVMLTVSALADTRKPPHKPASTVAVRAGDHGDFSRIVFAIPPGRRYKSEQLGDLLVLIFPGAGRIPSLHNLPPFVQAVTGGVGQAAIGIKAGQHTEIRRLRQGVVIDVYPPPK